MFSFIQVGKTASYLLFIKLLQEVVHSSNFIKVCDKVEINDYTSTLISTELSLPGTSDVLKAPFNSNSSSLYQHEKISPLIYFESIPSLSTDQTEQDSFVSNIKTQSETDDNFNFPSTIKIKGEIRSPISSEEPPSREITPNRQIFNDFSFSPFTYSNSKKECFSVIQQLPDLAFAYDKSHSCTNCLQHYGRPTQQSHEFFYYMKNALNTKLTFYIPEKQLVSFVADMNTVSCCIITHTQTGLTEYLIALS